MMGRAGPLFPKGYIWLFAYFCLFCRHGFPIGCGPWGPHPLCPQGGYILRSQRWDHRVNKLQDVSGSISFIIYIVSRELLVTKGNQVIPCFNMIWKSKGSHLTMHLILNLSLSSIMTEAGRFTLFPFKVILTSFQSNSIMSHCIFLLNLICWGVNFTVMWIDVCLLLFYTILLVHNTEHLIWIALF